jgi:hypothetical protein
MLKNKVIIQNVNKRCPSVRRLFLLDPSAFRLAGAKPGDRFQFVRMGYFCKDSHNAHTFNRIVTLKDSFKL